MSVGVSAVGGKGGGFGMKVVLDEHFWDEKCQFHPNLDESVPNRVQSPFPALASSHVPTMTFESLWISGRFLASAVSFPLLDTIGFSLPSLYFAPSHVVRALC